MDGQGNGLVIRMDIVTRVKLEIAMQLLITEISMLIKQANLKMDELTSLIYNHND